MANKSERKNRFRNRPNPPKTPEAEENFKKYTKGK